MKRVKLSLEALIPLENKKLVQFSQLLNFSFSPLRVMATLRSKRKLTVVSKDTKESIRNSQAQNTCTQGMTEVYSTQAAEDIEKRVTKKTVPRI